MFTDNKVNVNENLRFVLEKVENILGKGGNLFLGLFLSIVKSCHFM